MVKNHIEVDGVKFVKEDSIKKEAPKKDGLTLCILRTYSAGVWMGYVNYEKAMLTNCEVIEATRIWKWEGAFTLSNLAVNGTSKASDCRFANTIEKMKLNNVIEFLPISETARENLESVEKE